MMSIASIAQDTAQRVEVKNMNVPSQTSKPYVILISADGFRYDFADKYGAVNLQRLSQQGVRAKSMKPSYPSVTFPNHYTIATGMYPSHHGLVYNQYYDAKRKATYNMGDRKAVEDGTWYEGVPLWVLAEQQGMLSASYHFVGTEAPIKGKYPTYWYKYNDHIDIDQRIATVKHWLELPEEKRPHLITFYFSDVDHAGHQYGPETPQTRQSVEAVDAAIGKLTAALSPLQLPINYIFVSDHGMATVDTVAYANPYPMIDTAKFISRGGGTSLHLYAKDASSIAPQYDILRKEGKDIDVYLKNEIPAAWHYGTKDDRYQRVGDILIVPHYPKVISNGLRKITPGAHGYDPDLAIMHASFMAWGPAFKKNQQIPTFENVHVYPLICKILGLQYEHEIDGKISVLAPVLK